MTKRTKEKKASKLPRQSWHEVNHVNNVFIKKKWKKKSFKNHFEVFSDNFCLRKKKKKKSKKKIKKIWLWEEKRSLWFLMTTHEGGGEGTEKQQQPEQQLF